jgi:hypothetical protein
VPISDVVGQVGPHICDVIDCGKPTPPSDADGDGVPDASDNCPGTAAGAGVDSKGCSAAQNKPPDADGDGVPDSADTCPGTAPGATVDTKGCSAAQRDDHSQHVVTPDVDVHVTVPNGPAVTPAQPVVVNSPPPAPATQTTPSQPVIINSPAPNPVPAPTSSAPPVINVSVPAPGTQPSSPKQTSSSKHSKHKKRRHRRHRRHQRHS